jgi:hypothetical protein
VPDPADRLAGRPLRGPNPTRRVTLGAGVSRAPGGPTAYPRYTNATISSAGASPSASLTGPDTSGSTIAGPDRHAAASPAASAPSRMFCTPADTVYLFSKCLTGSSSGAAAATITVGARMNCTRCRSTIGSFASGFRATWLAAISPIRPRAGPVRTTNRNGFVR